MDEHLPPIGFIRLDEAFTVIRGATLGDAPSIDGGYGPLHKAYADRETILVDEFLGFINSTEFDAQVYAAHGERLAIQSDTFARTTLPDLLVYHRNIPSDLGGPLANYVGGIICLHKNGFVEWARKWVPNWLLDEFQNGRVSLDEAHTRAASIGAELKLQPKPSTKNVAMSETELIDWFLSRVQSWPNANPPPGKDQCYQDHRKIFKSRAISNRRFMKVRARGKRTGEVVPSSWRKSGKRGAGWHSKLDEDWVKKL